MSLLARVLRPSLLAGSLLALVALASLQLSPTRVEAQTPSLSGDIASSGVSFAVWSGGPTNDVATAASAKGCTAASVWLIAGGNLTGYIFGAPAFVNADFNAKYSGGLPAGPVLLVCRSSAPAPTPAPPAPSAGTSQNAKMARLETVIFNEINAERGRRGQAAYNKSMALEVASQKYAMLQISLGIPEPLDHAVDGTELWDRARAEGYPSFNTGEAIAAQFFSGDPNFNPDDKGRIFVYEQWYKSPPHFEIIWGNALPGASDLGVGCGQGVRPNGMTMIFCGLLVGKP